jgi:hypothetical protein
LTSYAEEILKSMTNRDGGAYFVWNQDEVLSLSQNYPFLWRLQFSNEIPVSWEPKSYSFEVLLKEEPILSGSLQFEKSILRLVLYWVGVVALFALFLAGLGILVFLTVRYYRKPLCPATGKVLSRSWRGSLFEAPGKFPVLMVFQKGQYIRSHVLKSDTLRIGSTLGCGLRLKYKSAGAGVLIREVAAQCFEIHALEQETIVINGFQRSLPRALQNGDLIQWGPFEIRFCFKSTEKTQKEAA